MFSSVFAINNLDQL